MEIERKYLVSGEFKPYVSRQYQIAQGYLSKDPDRTVRVRIRDTEGFLTIKGKSSVSGMSRFEWEKKIPLAEAQELLKLCLPAVIQKTRYIVPAEDTLFFEVDEFYGDNAGLILAEIEVKSEDQAFEKPLWLGEEVTGDPRYYNSYLSNAGLE